MRVLLGCDFFLKYAAGLARGLADAGAEVMLVTRDHDWEFGGRPGAMLEHVGDALGGRVTHRTLPGRVRDVAALRALPAVRAAVRAFAPDVIHLQDDVNGDPRLLLAIRPRRGRYALTVHDPAPHPGDEVPGPVFRATKRRLRRDAGLVFVHAESLRADMAGAVRPGVPIVVIPLGVPAPEPPPLASTPSLLFFGRMSYYKGLDVLLDAMPMVWRAVPDASLTVAGSGRVDEHPVLADPRVTLRNEHVEESALPALFGAARCVVLPYRQASQSYVGSQAKQFGRPIVATALGGLPELVGDGGRIVPPEDPEALADALVEVLSVPGRAETLGAAGAASVAASGSWERVAEATLDAYRRLMGV